MILVFCSQVYYYFWFEYVFRGYFERLPNYRYMSKIDQMLYEHRQCI